MCECNLYKPHLAIHLHPSVDWFRTQVSEGRRAGSARGSDAFQGPQPTPPRPGGPGAKVTRSGTNLVNTG